jgi:hypothetical protein
VDKQKRIILSCIERDLLNQRIQSFEHFITIPAWLATAICGELLYSGATPVDKIRVILFIMPEKRKKYQDVMLRQKKLAYLSGMSPHDHIIKSNNSKFLQH